MTSTAPSYVSTDPQLFRIEGATPVLMGSHCPACDISFYPRRWICAVCLEPVDDVDFAGRGVLASYTYIASPMYGRKAVAGGGYGIGQIDLDEGVRVQAVIGGAQEHWRIGQRFVAGISPCGEVEEGVQSALYEFSPDPGPEPESGA